ncbi:hypothetical protein E1B28_005701 [Marasmius oreades]|uniref:N-acetyltransferase domain-containing protein n=1 Tax=Marasmius oreades TaxID=181124 RepID=A0A9P7UW85_9AGAR|nr:uncharacterized protein E1B28_005701 [Marasmius oreades]KAG7094894.1 hypothetical protein E1B28_005701 [Marasmius oreades]
MDKQPQDIITMRVYHPNDFEQVKDLFSLGIVGPGSPGRLSFRLSYTHQYTFAVYMVLALGLWLSVSSMLWSITHYVGLLLVVLALGYLVWIFVKVRGFFEGYRLACLAEDLSDIPGYYKLVPSPTVTTAMGLTPITPSGFWVVEAHSPQSESTRKIVGCVALDYSLGDSTSADLRRFSVLPSYRCKGIGSLLLRTVVAHARCHRLSKVHITTTSFQMNAVRLYARHGWIAQPMKPVTSIGVLTFGHVEMDLPLR